MAEETGLLSIIVPVYQMEGFLRACVDSLLRQSVPLEVILVDDGSTDGSGAICDAYAARDARVRVIHKENGGSSSARLAGIRAARGAFLAFVDSDDWVDDDMFARLMEAFARQPQIDSAIGGYVSEAGARTQRNFRLLPPAFLLPEEAELRMFASCGFDWSLCGKVYRAELFREAAFLADWPHGYGEDTFISYHLMKRIRAAAYVPVQGYHYRMRGASMTHQPYHAGWMAYFDVYADVLADARQWSPTLASEILDVAVDACLSIRWRALRMGGQPEDIERMRTYFLQWQPSMAGRWTSRLRWRWEYAATISPEAYALRRSGWEEQLRRLARSATCLYLYGTGVIGEAFSDWLEVLDIPWDGAIETERHSKSFRGKPVCAWSDAASQDIAVLVAMNEKHTREVLPCVEASGTPHILEGWKMMFAGR